MYCNNYCNAFHICNLQYFYEVLYCIAVTILAAPRTSQYEVDATTAADGVAWTVCRSMCPCVCHDREPPKHGCGGRATISFVDSGGSSEPYVRVGPYPHAKEQF